MDLLPWPRFVDYFPNLELVKVVTIKKIALLEGEMRREGLQVGIVLCLGCSFVEQSGDNARGCLTCASIFMCVVMVHDQCWFHVKSSSLLSL